MFHEVRKIPMSTTVNYPHFYDSSMPIIVAQQLPILAKLLTKKKKLLISHSNKKMAWLLCRMFFINLVSYIIIVYIYTLWLFNIAMENGPSIVDLPIKNGDFPWLC